MSELNVLFDNGKHQIKSAGVIDNEPKPIRVITKRAFMKRIDQADRILIRKSVDDFVIDIHEDLKSATSVNLDDPDTIAGVDYLISKGLLSNTNLEVLFSDGTESIKGA